MFKRSLIAASLLAASISNVQALPYGFYDARSVAMGNVSVATGGLTTAALSNPAMLAINEQDDTFAILLPAVGVQAIDNGGMADLVDEFQVLEAQPASAQSITQMIDLVNQLGQTSIIANASVNAAAVFSMGNFTFAGSYIGSGQVSAGYTEITPGNIGLLQAPTGSIDALGVATQEIGFSMATKVSLMGVDVAVGVKPKVVQVDSMAFSQSVDIVDTADVVADAVESDLGSYTSLDAGIAISLLDSITVGAVAKDVISDDVSDGIFTFDPEPHLRVGASYHNSFLTVAADMDLTEIDPIAVNDSPSQVLAVGVELNALDFMQLRAGYQSNIASGADEPDLFSAGVGLWLGFHLDVAVVAGEDSSFGAFVQTGFRF